MKLLNAKHDVHLVVDYNDVPGTYKDGGDDMPMIPGGFSQTACGRTFGGLPEEQRLKLVTCTACKGSLGFEQAQQLEEMLDETD